MRIVSAEKRGSHLEFRVARGDDVFLFIFHTDEDRWTILKVRPDGEREVVTREEAASLLRDFPRHRAFRMLGGEENRGNH